jgi:hypothetical protein
MSRAVWVDAGNDPDYAKLADNGITWPYFDIREQRLTDAYLDAVRAHPAIDGCGVYVVASWLPGFTGPQLAEWTDARLRAIGWLGNPPVMFDIEGTQFDVQGYVLPCLRRWRELRPKRITDLTIEGHKGSLFTPADVINVVAKVRWVVPQCYNGAMTQVWDSAAMLHDLTAHSFPPASVYPFLDAAHLGEWWEGFAFTQGRLP